MPLAAHDEVLRSAIEAHGGWLFKHTGDGVIAAFASPKAAVDAAIAAQRQLELPVRMGIATGEAALQDGDYFGAVLNRAARVMAAGHGGQVLVADSTAALLSGVDLLDLGPRRLRDVPTPVGLFQVRAPDLREDFPPLRALDPSPGNLRQATTSFVGRDSEVAEIKEALRAHRLVTLTGVGGVGKTRLALEVAAQMSDEFPDGVWLFELAAVTDPAAVPDAVAAVLGITQQPGKTVSESVAAALEGRVRLLVFDNCEHVLDAAADLIEAVLGQSATVKIMPPAVKDSGSPTSRCGACDRLTSDTAMELFVERARTVAQGFSADDTGCSRGDLPSSRRYSVGHRIGGIPDGVDDSRRGSRPSRSPIPVAGRFPAGSGTSSNAATRGAVVIRPSRRGGKDTAGAVFGVLGRIRPRKRLRCIRVPSDEFAILDLLDALVRKSLLVADRSSGRTRFSMLETIRQFAEEQLAASGAATEYAYGARPLLRGTRSRHPGAVGQPPAARGLHMVHRRTRQPTRQRFGGPPTMATSTPPPQSPSYAGLPRRGKRTTRTMSPTDWAEELIDRPRSPSTILGWPRCM